MDGELIVGLLAIILLISPMILSFWGIHFNTGNGHQVGYVSAIETGGIFFKTKTVYIKPEMESTQEDVYCLIDSSLEEQLREVSNKKQKIEIEYMSYLLPSFRECKNEGAIITGFIVQ